MEDNTGILWIGTYNKGINILDEKSNRFELYQRNNYSQNSLGDNNVTSFAEDDQGNVWIGADGGGLSYFNTKSRKFTKSVKDEIQQNNISNNAIICLLMDSKENLWWVHGPEVLIG